MELYGSVHNAETLHLFYTCLEVERASVIEDYFLNPRSFVSVPDTVLLRRPLPSIYYCLLTTVQISLCWNMNYILAGVLSRQVILIEMADNAEQQSIPFSSNNNVKSSIEDHCTVENTSAVEYGPGGVLESVR